MAEILMEFEGLTKNRVKTVMKKINHCGFNTLVTHIQVQCTTHDEEMTAKDQREDATDIQPVQPNSIYLKCEVLDSAAKYSGKGDSTLLAVKRNLAPHIKLMAAGRSGHKAVEAILPTESPIEDEVEPFDLSVKKDIIFLNPAKNKEIGFYNRAANVLWISDLIHNPLRSEFLLDRAISFVYELQKCGTLSVITPIFEKHQKELDKKGFTGASLWWSGFEDTKDTAYIDGRLDAKKFFEEEADHLIENGVDIFFLRNLKNYERGSELIVDKCVAKLTVNQPSYSSGQLSVPGHTTLEQEIKAIEAYVSLYAKGVAKEFYDKAKKELEKQGTLK